MCHNERGGLTREGANQGLPFHFIASFFTGESCEVPEGCCCQLRWVSGRSDFCNRSSLIEPGCGENCLIYTFGSMTSGGVLRGLYCITYRCRLFQTNWRLCHQKWRTDKKHTYFYVPAQALQATIYSCTRQKGRKDSDGRVQDVR